MILERFFAQFVDPVRIGGGFPAIVDPCRNAIIRLEGELECGDKIGFVVAFFYRVDPVLVPFVRIESIEGYTGLQDVNQCKPAMADAGLNQVTQLFALA